MPATTLIDSRDGVAVAVHDFGGPGRPTTFVAGTGLCAGMWEPIVARLPADRYRCLTIDLRGHGASTTPDDVTFTDDDLVADLTAVAEAFDLRDAWGWATPWAVAPRCWWRPTGRPPTPARGCSSRSSSPGRAPRRAWPPWSRPPAVAAPASPPGRRRWTAIAHDHR
ncbi:MAG: alpha/beta fold hydrolase [Acidimicrobiales bacterium]